jgi:acyl phosphate:glycerol-3-phosphate acyltransferase
MGLISIIAASAVIGYLLGSVNTTIVVGKLYGQDVTKLGSKSAGLTNALRVLGKRAAAMVLVGDVAKGVLACLIGQQLGSAWQPGTDAAGLGQLFAGAGAVVGHNWPIFFNFKGGKGALTAAAVMFMINWQLSAISLALFIALVALTRFVSLGTMSAAVFFAAASFVPMFETARSFQLFACTLAAIIVFKHRENIRRLRSGTENRLSF